MKLSSRGIHEFRLTENLTARQFGQQAQPDQRCVTGVSVKPFVECNVYDVSLQKVRNRDCQKSDQVPGAACAVPKQ